MLENRAEYDGRVREMAVKEGADMAWTGRKLAGRYTLGPRLGMGGMGSVYAATQDDLGRRVAIKILHPHLAERTDLITRFRREAMAAAALGHPNIVPVTDFAQVPGQPPFLVMEHLEGEDLRSCIAREGTLSADRVAFIAVQILSALEATHAAGIIHRDLKPENIFLTSITGVRDIVKVLDFGLAKHGQSEGPTLTETGAVMGTPAYMAPEQVAGQPVTPATDLYAVGAVMFHALTGQLPFSGQNNYALMYAIAQGQRASIQSQRPDLDPDFAAVIERALTVDPGQRYANATAMRHALASFVQTSAPLHSVALTPAAVVSAHATPGSPAEQPTLAASVPGFASTAPSMPSYGAQVSPTKSGSTTAALVGGLVGAVVVLLLAVGIGTFFLLQREDPADSDTVIVGKTAPVPEASAEAPPSPAPPPSPEQAPPPEAADATPPAPPAPPPELARDENRPSLFQRLGLRDGEDQATEHIEDAAASEEIAEKQSEAASQEEAKEQAKKKTKKKKKKIERVPTAGTKPRLVSINAHSLLTLDVIKAEMATILPKVTTCYEEHEFSPGEHVHTSYHLFIDETGKVTKAVKMGSRERSIDLDGCTLPLFRTLDFGTPKTEGGGKIDISYTARIAGQ